MNWDKFYLSMAYLYGMKSRDDSTQVGAVITTKDNVFLTAGYNGIPRGIEYKEKHQKRPDKYHYFEHAERNAIYNASRNNIDLSNAYNIYVPWHPCSDCARAIIQVGIKRVVIHDQCNRMVESSSDTWSDSHKIASEMFDNTGVNVVRYADTLIDTITGKVRGNVFNINNIR